MTNDEIDKLEAQQKRQVLMEQLARDVHDFVGALIGTGMAPNEALNMGSFLAQEGYRTIMALYPVSIQKGG